MSQATFRVAAKAFIKKDNEFLLLREAAGVGGVEPEKYQIPGGGLEEDEDIEQALMREVKEEAGLTIKPIMPFYVDGWKATVNGEKRQIIAIFYLCDYKSGEVKLSDEHDDYAWVSPDKLKDYKVPHPVPQLFQKYQELNRKNWGNI